MEIPDGLAKGERACFSVAFALGAKVCDNRGLRSKKSGVLAVVSPFDRTIDGSAKELS